MITKEHLINDLFQLKINPKGTILVHSSYKSIGETENGADTVVDAFMEYMKDGLLVFPTHTWDNIQIDGETTMDVVNTPVCVGIIPEIFRKRPGVVRSLHPTHSVAAFGKDADSFIENEEQSTTPCGLDFVYGKLLRRRATIVLVGVDYTCNTFIHGIEEWNEIPGRLRNEAHDLYVKRKDGHIYHTPQYRHCGELGSSTYWKIEELMKSKGIMYEGKLGNSLVKVTDAYRLNEALEAMLSIDPHVLTDNEPLKDFWYDIQL